MAAASPMLATAAAMGADWRAVALTGAVTLLLGLPPWIEEMADAVDRIDIALCSMRRRHRADRRRRRAARQRSY